jgi:predicted aspartyl protease
MLKPIHFAFNVAYNGIARELISGAAIIDPLTGKSLDLNRVIWDSGATNSVISRSVAQKIGSTPTGAAQVMTANGPMIVNTYLIHIDLPQKVIIPNLDVSEGDLGPDTEMLIGMDVIAIGDFTVQNHNGKTHFSFCVPPFDNKYDMIAKATQINQKNSKHNEKHS